MYAESDEQSANGRSDGTDAAGEYGAEGAIVREDTEEAVRIEAVRCPGVAALFLDANALAAGPGGGRGETSEEAGVSAVERLKLQFKRKKQLAQERFRVR